MDQKKNPYRDFINGENASGALRSTSTISGVSNLNPDTMADGQRLGEKYGILGPLSDTAVEELRMREKRETISSIVKSSPGLSSWLSNAGNASVAHDDVENLGSVSNEIRKRREREAARRAESRKASIEKHGWVQWALFGVGSPGEAVVDFLSNAPRAATSGAGRGAGSAVTGIGRAYRAIDQTMLDALYAAVDNTLGEDAAKAVQDAVTIPPSMARYVDPATILTERGSAMKDAAEAFDVPVEERDFGTDVAGAIGQIGFQVAAFYLTGGASGTASLYGQGVDIQADQLLQEGVDLSTPEARAAMGVGGIVTMATEKIGLDRIMSKLPKGVKNRISGLLWKAFQAGGTEALTEAAEGILQKTVTYFAAGVDEDLPNYILKGAGYDAAVGGTAGAAFNVMMNLMLPGRRGVLQSRAEEQRQQLDELHKAAMASALRERSPQKFREAVAAMHDDAGGTGAIYLPPEVFAEYFQSGDETPQEAAEAMGIAPSEYEQAAAAGADMAIPIETYLAHVDEAGHQAIADHIKFEADGMSLAELASGEVEAQVEEFRAQVEEKVRQIEEAGQEAGDLADQARQVMREAGLPDSEAEPLSVMLGAMMNTMANRTGVSASEFAQAIGGLPAFNMSPPDVVQGIDNAELDALLDELRAAPQAEFGDVQVDDGAETAVSAGAQAVGEYLDNLGVNYREMSNQDVRNQMMEIQEQQAAAAGGSEIQQALPNAERMTPEDEGRVKIKDAYTVFTEHHMATVGRKLDPVTDEDDYQAVLEMAATELEEQLGQQNSGVGWYTIDTQNAIDMTSRVFPSLAANEDHRDFYLTLAAVFSNGLTPEQAWSLAAEAFDLYLQTGVIPTKRVKADGSPVRMTTYKDKNTGKMVEKPASWGPKGASNEQQLEFIKHLVETKGGLRGAIEWLTTVKPRSEINDEMVGSGLYKSGRYKTKAEISGEDTYGFLAFGPKLGRYAMGLYGVNIDAGDTTIDMWYIRTFRRYSGRTLEGPVDPKTGVVGQPKNNAERDAVFRMTGDLSERFDLDPGDVQAALWFFEKRLLATQGINTTEGTNSSGARQLLEKRGIDVDDGTRGPRADDVPGATYEQGAQGAGVQASRAGRLPGRGELGGGVGRLETAYEAAGGTDLARLPSRVWVPGHGDVDFHGYGVAQRLAESYAEEHGIDYRPPRTYARVDVERAERIAQAFEEMEHRPGDPEVKAAYDAMIKETIDQFNWIVQNSGLTVEFISTEAGDPYKSSPRMAVVDVVTNNHMWVYSTRDGFGSSEEFDPVDNPLLAETDIEISGQKALVNDIFRVVHDYFGHVKNGVGFRAAGEENAWRAHSAMYSPLARRAMTTETRGQNSWVNYGPHGDSNRLASAEDTVFADQKIGLLPDWVVEEGAFDERDQAGSDLAGDVRSDVQRPRPARRADGRIELTHWSDQRDVTELDPEREFSSAVGRKGSDARRAEETGDIWVNRTYYGLNQGRRDGYQKELGLGPVRYTASVDPDDLYDFNEDPQGIRQRVAENFAGAPDQEILSRQEAAIRQAGYAGYWTNHPQLKMAAAVFEPLPVESQVDEDSEAERQARRARSVASILLSDRGITDTRRKAALAKQLADRAGNDTKRLDSELEAMELFQGPVGRDTAVVDENGDPLVVYHVTASDFDNFEFRDLEAGGKVFEGTARKDFGSGLGFHFSVSPKAGMEIMEKRGRTDEARVIRAHLDIKNPIDMPDLASIEIDGNTQQWELAYNVAEQLRRQGVIDKGDVSAIGSDFEVLEKILRSKGYDGIRYINAVEDEGSMTYVAFSPEQIIQLTEPMELEQADIESDAFKAWFGDSKVVDENGEPLVVYHGAKSYEGFSEFRTKDSFSGQDRGAWFSPSKRYAARYAYPRFKGGGAGSEFGKQKKHIVASYLRVRNPYFGKLSDLKGEGSGFNRLRQNGYDAYVPFDPEGTPWDKVSEIAVVDPDQIKSIHNSGAFDPSDPNILNQRAAAKKPRGSIILPAGGITQGRTVVNLFSGRDLSTSLHELSHYFLEVLRVSARMPNASQDVRDMWAAAQKELGIEGIADTHNIPVEAHEKWAEMGESYFGDGKAPSVELQSSFERFRAWMLQVWAYAKRVLGRDAQAKVSPEVRQVLDRMLATDEQIAEQERVNATHRAFDSEDAVGMTPDEWARYVAQDDRARAEARRRAQTSVAEELEKRRSQMMRSARKQALEEARASVAQDELMQAVEVLTNGRRLGGDNDNDPEGLADIKIDRQAIIDLGYGDHLNTRANTAAGNDLFPRGKGVIYSETEGMTPDTVAAILGFESGADLLDALLVAPKPAVAIEAEADRIMAERFGDLLNDGGLVEEIAEGIHSSERAKLIDMELNALYRKAPVSAINQKSPGRKIIREVARRMSADMLLSKARREDIFLSAERKAAREAMRALAKGDFAEAREQKQRQLINFFLWSEARAINKQIQKDQRLIKAVVRREDKAGKGRDIDYVRAARVVLSRFGIASEPRGYSFSDWVDDLRVNDPQLLDEISRAVAVATGAAKPYKDITATEYTGMMDAVRSLMEAAKNRRTAELAGERFDIEDARTMIVDRLSQAYPKDYLSNRGQGFMAGVKDRMLSMKAALRRVHSWARFADGEDDGPIYNMIVKPVQYGIDRYRDRKEVVIKRALEILEPRLKDAYKSGTIDAPELNGFRFQDKSELLTAILNTGNESNAEKLLQGYNWTQQGWDAFIDRAVRDGILTKADFDTVQSIWDLIESLRPEAQSAHRKIYGHYFDRIPSRPLRTPFGVYRGGYFPIAYDRTRSPVGQNVDANRLFDEQQSSAMFPTTGKGFTMKRSNVTAPVDLSMRMIPSHIDKVLRFTYIQPEVRSVARILSGHEFKNDLFTMDPELIQGLLMPWLQRSASQAVEIRSLDRSVGWFDGPARFARRSAGATTMVLNYVNALQQFTGFFPAVTRVKPTSLARGMATYYTRPRVTTRFIFERSPFMRRRVGVDAQEAMSDISRLLSRPSLMKSLGDFSIDAGYVLQRVADRLVAQPIWLAAYNEATANGMRDAQAAAHADSVVRETQSSFNAEDVSAIEVGTPLKRIFTMFLNFFNAQYNLMATEAGKAAREKGLVRGLPRIAAAYMAIIAMPAVMAELIGAAFRGGLEDEDEDGMADDGIWFVVDAQVRYMLAMIPFLGQAANAIWGAFDDKSYNDRVSLSPVTMVPEKVGQAAKSISKQVKDGDNEARTVKDVLTAVMMLLGLGGGNQVGKAAGYTTGVVTGEYRPRDAVDVIRGVSTGREIE